MCGIAGFWTRAAIDAGRAAQLAGAMATALAHRGPDGHGVWTDPSGIALAHRRLAVVELSEAGAQPMHSHSGRWTVTYNGEIYNHGALRERLVAEQGCPMRGRSDTEVLVEALDRWGVATTLERIDGMFAFAAWDRDRQALVLAIDRFGEKPLCYGWSGGDTLLFGSEPAALDRHPAFAPVLCREAVVDLMQFGYVPAPRTLFEGVRKCPPGSVVTFTAADLRAAHLPPPVPYWRALAVAAEGAEGAAEGAARSEGLSEAQWVDRLSDVLARSVGRQLQADVPVGAFLSGGIDSTTIVAVAQSISTRPLRTYTVGFDGVSGSGSGSGYSRGSGSESAAAAAVAAHLKTDHHDVHFGERDLLALVPRIPEICSEPFADASLLPTQLVSCAARADVTVALSGDGGDELFGGYDRYLALGSLGGLIDRYPGWLRKGLASALLAVPARHLDRAYESVGSLGGRAGTYRDVGDKLHKLARGLDAADCRALYRRLVTRWPRDSGLVLGGASAATPERSASAASTEGSASAATGEGRPSAATPEVGHAWPPANDLAPDLEWMMGADTVGYLPGDILAKVDRAAMSGSLETRMPFLDRRVFECAWSMPTTMKVRGRESKVALRRLLDRHVPRSLVERPKTGFGIPIDDWLRGPLREWASDL
ncbi:MAG: asparagine synthase (glutamine-hydrolyzing), partial [Burkholderiaceae bacterium]